MCGIVGGIAQRNIAPLLLEGLMRLEYRGYDSAGMAVLEKETQKIKCVRVKGKVAALAEALKKQSLSGSLGIAHTRWATHGKPSKRNAHPQCSRNSIALVHNGVLENYTELYQKLVTAGYQFKSETDTEAIAHLIHYYMESQSLSILAALKKITPLLKGAYALGIMTTHEPHKLYAVRCGSPLVIGINDNEKFIASDPIALSALTEKFIYLKEGDIASIEAETVTIYNKNRLVKRPTQWTKIEEQTVSKGKHRHYMKKEIFEQPQALLDTLNHYLSADHLLHPPYFNTKIENQLKKIKRIQLVACGTSYHATLIGRYWIESLVGIPCQVDVASENLCRPALIEPHTLFIALSQSGETADTLAAMRQAKKAGYAATLAISNVAQSTLIREADFAFLTCAGIEIGVAATKTFTAQLLALLLFAICLQGLKKPKLHESAFSWLAPLQQLPDLIRTTLLLNDSIKKLSKQFSDKQHALFLGRGHMFPIALEGALKLKEISYIHAEAYPAGELKHGPLALVDEGMPIVIVAHNDQFVKKLEANVNAVKTRGGKLYVFMDQDIDWQPMPGTTLIKMPPTHPYIAPIAYAIPLQLLAYHVAVLKGTDVDQPRHLAKSVTVE